MISINDNKRLYNGFFTVCDAVSQTMGAQGKFAIMENEIMGNPIITKDGISTAKRINFDDPQRNMGANLAKQVAARTLVKVGDGTTTSLVLARAMIKNTKKGLFKKDYFFNKRVEEGMDMAYEDIKKYLKALSKPVDEKVIKNIAIVSSNNNKEIGDLVYSAYEAIGKNGVISIEENSDSIVSRTDIFKGMKLKSGWVSPFLINNQKTAKFEASNALVLVYEGVLEGDITIQDFLGDNRDRPIVIISERFSDDVIIKLQDLNQSQTLDITAVQCPEYDNKRKALLEDVALYTGGEVFVRGTSKELKAGIADKIIVSESTCSIVQKEQREGVSERVENLQSQLEEVNDKDFIRQRIQNLTGISATIYVGGTTPSEAKEKYDRVDDSVNSIQSAQEEGWICGGGSALVHISALMKTIMPTQEHQFGYNAIKKSLEAPLKQICINANRGYGYYLKKAKKSYGKGYNAYTDKEANLIKDGIIDSTKSIRIALENALSVSKLLLNTSVIITRKDE